MFVEEPLDDFNYVFSNLELANMMEFSLLNKNMYELKSIQEIIDAQFELESRGFFLGQLWVYTIGFCLPYGALIIGIENL